MKDFFKKFVPTAGFFIGIILVAIGATMFIGSTLKLAFVDSLSTPDHNPCIDSLYVVNKEEVNVRTEEEELECIEKYNTEERKRFIKRQHVSMIDGVAFLLVGAFFWIYFKKR